MVDCIFCKIIARQVPSQIVTENEHIIVIKDISPKASIHYLIIPKKHVRDIKGFKKSDFGMAASMFEAAQQLSENDPQAKDFRLIVNSGSKAGQCVFHVHMHFLAGEVMPQFD